MTIVSRLRVARQKTRFLRSKSGATHMGLVTSAGLWKKNLWTLLKTAFALSCGRVGGTAHNRLARIYA